MRYEKSPLRPGMTAIAAVLAMSSTPLFAQAAEAPMVTPPPVSASAPVVEAPAPAPVVQSAAPAPTPAAPATAPSLSAVADSIRSDTASSETQSRAAPVRSTPARTARPAPTTRTAQVAPIAAPVAAVPVAAVAPAPAPAAKTGPVEFDPQPAPPPAETASADNDLLPIAGGVGAAILLLGGGAFALTRRRRRDEDDVYAADELTTIEREPLPEVAPAMATPVAPAPAYTAPMAEEPPLPYAQPGVTQPVHSPASAAIAGAPATRLPTPFDLSRYGRHVQAAYQGPTENNPSLSLRRRLARARFYDQRERMAAEGTLPPQASTAPAPAAQQAAATQRQTEHITTRINRPQRPGFRPAFSS